MGRPQPDLDTVAGRLAERLDGRPVDHPVRRRPHPPAPRPQPAQQRRRADVDADQPHPAEHRRQVEVGGPDDLLAVDVDELVVEHVPAQHDLAGPAGEVPQVEPGRAQDDLGVLDLLDRRRVDERQPAADPDDQPGHRRVRLAVRPAGDDVDERADLVAGLVAHRPADEAGHRDDGLADRGGGQDAFGPVPAGARSAAGGVEDAPAGSADVLGARRDVAGGTGRTDRSGQEEVGHRGLRSQQQVGTDRARSARSSDGAAGQPTGRAHVARGRSVQGAARRRRRRRLAGRDEGPPGRVVRRAAGSTGGFAPGHRPHLLAVQPSAGTPVLVLARSVPGARHSPFGRRIAAGPAAETGR